MHLHVKIIQIILHSHAANVMSNYVN